MKKNSKIQHNAELSILLDSIQGVSWTTDSETISKFSKDLFYSSKKADVIIQPRGTNEISRVIQAVQSSEFKIAVRGGGLSYSAGYLVERENTLLLDMRFCDQIIEINADDMFVIVGAGTTWKKLDEALQPHGMRAAFWGTGSGLHATVGGSLSQNAINYGSGKYGTAAENVTGLKIILPNGKEIRTGSWADNKNMQPFNRYYGPDLTGLFLGDSGAFGIKAEIALPLILRPAASAFIAFAFESITDFSAALTEVGRNAVVSECFGFDQSFLAARAVSGGFAEGLDSMRGRLLKEFRTGLKKSDDSRSAKEIDGLRPFTAHMSVDCRDNFELQSSMSLINQICNKHRGLVIDGELMRAIREKPFPAPEMLLGANGDRWVPMHGVIPFSLYKGLLVEIEKFFKLREVQLKKEKISWSHVSNLIGNSRILVEVNLYWRDSIPDSFEDFLDEEFINGHNRHPHNSDVYNGVKLLRSELINLFQKFGSTHLQIGKTYPYLTTRMGNVSELILKLKTELDPAHRINPGVLGLE